MGNKKQLVSEERLKIIEESFALSEEVLELFDGKGLLQVVTACSRALAVVVHQSGENVDDLMSLFNGSFNAALSDENNNDDEQSFQIN